MSKTIGLTDQELSRLLQPAPELAPTTDHGQAKARVLSVLAGADPVVAARPAFQALQARNAALCEADGAHVRAALADQVMLLESMTLNFAHRAAKAKHFKDAEAYAGVAIKASTALTQTLMVLARQHDALRDREALEAE